MIALAAFLLVHAPVQDADPIAEVLRANRYALRSTADEWSGTGAEFLVAMGRESMAFLVGESHGNRETPELVAALLRELRPHGYGTLAIETGPFSAERLVELARADDPLAALREFFGLYPFGVPFFEWRAEARMLIGAVQSGYRVWGLDQEFIGSARHLLAELETLALNRGARDAARAAQARAWELAEATEDGRGDTFLSVTEPEDFDALRAAFEGADARALTIIDELAESAVIYQLWDAGRNYRSNHRRVGWMKGHLLGELATLDASGAEDRRVFMKFGAMHMGRGYSALNQLDLGNQAAELALARGADSFHLNVFGARQVGADGREADFASGAPHLAPMFDAMHETDWTVFDLRPLRPLLHPERQRAAHPQLAQFVFRFDAIALYPSLHGARSLNE